MESCSRKIHFCYGHRVMNHENKCATLHGHNGVVWISAVSLIGNDELGRVIDFSVLKERVGGWIDQYWDHTTIVNREDVALIELLNKAPRYKDIFILDNNPTAENMAHYLMWKVCPEVLKGTNVVVNQIEFWETENCRVCLKIEKEWDKLLKEYSS